ncbi:hypothetical protein BCR33DRAFT_784253 [Rhizoclosmatium globosum]|uniref:L domain-like protein n=1 Tax=Rhizoclosmatium globosum TaxID=329046 RepID=A0A1Y2CEJ0_9FUNG|nr:hypothetical protein BCR33DRAFT_784253 [Rhizoclosmatium globosum]|eukprot:ORY45463.1 hypothetical protein BCR33DRAFT_784253 [Rhizoclosmatium globosum]
MRTSLLATILFLCTSESFARPAANDCKLAQGIWPLAFSLLDSDACCTDPRWGVARCSKGRITGIDVSNIPPTGAIPDFSTLTLPIRPNFTELPAEYPPSLETLDVESTPISGGFPSNLPTSIKKDVSNNNLSGSIPPKFKQSQAGGELDGNCFYQDGSSPTIFRFTNRDDCPVITTTISSTAFASTVSTASTSSTVANLDSTVMASAAQVTGSASKVNEADPTGYAAPVPAVNNNVLYKGNAIKAVSAIVPFISALFISF